MPNDLFSPTTTNELLEILTYNFQKKEDQGDEKPKYVMYVRKSTDDKEKQVRSIGDQILECKEFANRHDLLIAGVIDESESAKEPGIRPKFTKMLDDIKTGKYDGIIAWHPDRLARNMKEAGEIIDLLDKNIIKELRFISFQFTNDTSGKVLLGITFVMSKQYSDQLSDNVKRGIARSIEEGKYINSAKHGYYKDKNQLLRPDEENFILIVDAFKMKIAGKTLDEICVYLNKKGYSRARKEGGRHEIYRMDKKRLSEVLRDPIYAGVVMYGEHIANLTEIYDFIPAVSVEDYMKINNLKNLKKTIRLIRNARGKANIQANLMRGLVYCGKCNSKMTSGITTKKVKDRKIKYYYYRCENEKCETGSVRAHVIINAAVSFLETNPFSNKHAYAHYKKEMRVVIEKREHDLIKERLNLIKERPQTQAQITRIKELWIEEKEGIDDIVRESFKKDVVKGEKRLLWIEERLEEIKNQLVKSKEVILNYENFLELMQNLAKNTRNIKEMEALDFVLRKMFSNFTIMDEKTAIYTLNSPFRELVESGKVRDSRSERT